MRKHFIYILLGALAMPSAQGLFSCKTSQKRKVRADSSIVRQQERTENWTRQIVTEFILEPTEKSPVSGLPCPSLLGFQVPAAKDQGINSQKDETKTVSLGDVPYIGRPYKGRVIVRQTEKITGEVKEKKQEQKQVHTTDVSKVSKPKTTGYGLLVISLGVVVLLLFLIFKHKRRD